MKLNLLPKTLGKAKAVKRAWVGFVFLTLLGIGSSIFMIVSSQKRLDTAKAEVAELEPQYQTVQATSAAADTAIGQVATLVNNVQMAHDMLDHNAAYPDAYDFVRKYIPSFYRVNAMTITPIDDNTAQLTTVGVLKTRQEYTDLLLALQRIPGQTQVTRTAYNPQVRDFIPNVTQDDPLALRHKRNEPGIPKDPEAQVNQEAAKGGVTGYRGVGNFGVQDDSVPRGAMPEYQVITTTVTFPRKLQVVLPRATLSKIAPAPDAGAAATPGAAAPKGATPARGGQPRAGAAAPAASGGDSGISGAG